MNSFTASSPKGLQNHSTTGNSILNELQQLIEVIAQLRNPEGGCPWDLAQT
ncbi:MAG: nucleoside triphosphate pyrophosphohydrolase, partial [Cyanobacteria bacterium J06588_5]